MGEPARPNRWLRLRHPDGFGEREWTIFQANCRVLEAYVRACLAEADTFRLAGAEGCPNPRYEFFPPTLSADRTTATLPLGGPSTVGTRATFEDASAWMLSDHLPFEFRLGCEEGLTEPAVSPSTSWRPATCRVRS